MKFPWQKKTAVSVNGITTADPGYSFMVYSLSETGPTRNANEDSIVYFFTDTNQQDLFAMVADGMGGHNAGEVASHIACQVAEEFVVQEHHQSDPNAMLGTLMHTMHYAIRNAADNNEEYKGMGTTATLLFIKERKMFFAHIGDSRLYHFSHNMLQQLSTDQTLVQQMVKEGTIKPQEAATHEMKHVLLQALGTVEKVEPEVSGAHPVNTGDYFFLCSDGIYDVLSDSEIGSLLSMRQPALAMECIKALCYRRRASDNFSALLVEVIVKKSGGRSAATREQNTML